MLPSKDLDVSFTGGEPLLEVPILRRAVTHIEHCRRGGPPVRFNLLTNGLLLDRRTLKYLDAHDFSLHLSFDGVPRAQADRGRSTFERLHRLLALIREEFPRLWRSRLTVAITLSPAAVPRFAASVDYFIRQGVPTLSVAPAMGRGRWRLERIDELDRQFDLATAALRLHYDRTGDVPLAMFRRPLSDGRHMRATWLCGSVLGKSVAIDVDGQAYGCVLACSSYQGRTCDVMRPTATALALGPVLSPSFPARLASMRAAARAAGVLRHPERRYSSYRRCIDCEFFGQCAPCPLGPSISSKWDDPLRVPDFVCAFSQVMLEHRAHFPPQPDLLDLLGRQRRAGPSARGARANGD
jgi:sulfatase maturation enzyme AslB (radical SAM superfamily)